MAEPKWKEHWPEFSEKMKKRLQQGFEEYGDGSFSRDPLELIKELREEVQDITGWGFILDVRLKAMEEELILGPGVKAMVEEWATPVSHQVAINESGEVVGEWTDDKTWESDRDAGPTAKERVKIINSDTYREAEVILFYINMRQARAKTVGDNVDVTIYLMEQLEKMSPTAEEIRDLCKASTCWFRTRKGLAALQALIKEQADG